MPTHTPGPWEADMLSGILKIRGPADQKRYKQREVCRMYGRNRANIDLICAAPDLLAALKELMQTPGNGVTPERYPAALAAIAKAEGSTDA